MLIYVNEWIDKMYMNLDFSYSRETFFLYRGDNTWRSTFLVFEGTTKRRDSSAIVLFLLIAKKVYLS
jgi:hypothetical protein